MTTRCDGMQERNDALETAYGLSRNNYELTIRHQRLLIIFFCHFLVAIFGIGVFYYISYISEGKG